MKLTKDHLAQILFVASFTIFAFVYGFISGRHEWFPHKFMVNAEAGLKQVMSDVNARWAFFYQEVDHDQKESVFYDKRANDGINLITCVLANNQIAARIMDNNGNILHEWLIDWFEIWPNPSHLPESEKPKGQPGGHIHGAAVLENGDLVFLFDDLGAVRMSQQGEVIWRLPYSAHHAIDVHDDGNIWMCGHIHHETIVEEYRRYKPLFKEPTVIEVSPDGQILREISVFKLLKDNGLSGLLYTTNLNDLKNFRSRNTLHLNDVERFPETMTPGFFNSNDVMISLRNISTVLVFNLETLKIKYISTGRFVHQHDPDFIDGNTISVFDNNMRFGGNQHGSRVVHISPLNDDVKVIYGGNAEQEFYTRIMGKHQTLPNGNVLVTSSMEGRAFEITPDGEIVWQYINWVDGGLVGIVEEVTRLPAEDAGLFQGTR